MTKVSQTASQFQWQIRYFRRWRAGHSTVSPVYCDNDGQREMARL